MSVIMKWSHISTLAHYNGYHPVNTSLQEGRGYIGINAQEDLHALASGHCPGRKTIIAAEQ